MIWRVALLMLAVAGLAVVGGAETPVSTETGSRQNRATASESVGREEQTRKDAHGDELPENAVARLGTVRLRQCTRIVSVAYSSDGKFIASGEGSGGIARLWSASTGKELVRLQPLDPVRGRQYVLFSPDARYLTYLAKDGLHFWDIAVRRCDLSVNAKSPIAFSPDSRFIAAVFDRDFVIFDLKSCSVKIRLDPPKLGILSVAFSPDGKLVAAAEGKGHPFPSTIRLWDAHTGKHVAELTGHKYPVKSLSFSPDGEILASAGENIRLWNVPNHKEIAVFDQPVTAAVFSPKGKLLAGCTGAWIHLWDPVKRKRVRVMQAHNGWIESIAFSPDGNKLLTGGASHALGLWDVETGRPVLPLTGHTHSVLAAQFSPDGMTLASRSGDQTVRIWNVVEGTERHRLSFGTPGPLAPEHTYRRRSCTLGYSSDGKTLFALGGAATARGGEETTVRVWDAVSGQIKTDIHDKHPPDAIALSADGQTLATSWGNTRVQLWSIPSGKVIPPLLLPTGKPPVVVAPGKVLRSEQTTPLSLGFSPDGRTLAAGCFPEGFYLWDWTTRRHLADFSTRKQAILSMAFSPGGQVLASCGAIAQRRDDTINLWENATGTLIHTINGQSVTLTHIVFSPNGRLLASAGGDDAAVRIWDVFTGKELAKFTGHRGPVYCVAFSPDGKTVASGSADTTILLWDVSKLQPEQPPSIARNELPKALPRFWDEMQAKDGAKAYQAIWRLLGAEDDAAAFLGGKLQPVAAPDAKLLQQAIADLDSKEFDKREAGNAHLMKLGELAEPALRQALKEKPSLEARKRIERLLADIAERPGGVESLRQIRALHALELIGSPAARDVLKKLARGADGARLTRDAKLALQRLERRANKP